MTWKLGSKNTTLLLLVGLCLIPTARSETVQDYLIKIFMTRNNFETSDAGFEDLKCMTANIIREGAGEGIHGWIAVAQTVRNRIKDTGYPNTPCSVIWQSGQFEWTEKYNGNNVSVSFESSEDYLTMLQISDNALKGDFDGYLNGAMHYWNADIVTPCWKKSFDKFFTIGNHTFALNPNGGTPCYDLKVDLSLRK